MQHKVEIPWNGQRVGLLERWQLDLIEMALAEVVKEEMEAELDASVRYAVEAAAGGGGAATTPVLVVQQVRVADWRASGDARRAIIGRVSRLLESFEVALLRLVVVVVPLLLLVVAIPLVV